MANEDTIKAFNDWLAKQSAEVQSEVNTRVSALVNAFNVVKEENKTYKDTIADLSGKVKGNTEAEQSISGLNDKLGKAEKKASFYEAATGQGCTKPKLALLAAEADNLYDAQGNPDWKKIKESVPEFFNVAKGKQNAGSGTIISGQKTDVGAAFNQAVHSRLS